MNNFNCEILADSKNPQGDRITTMKVTFPRFILAEFNTHRMFSRNSASSRAIPFNKMVKMVEENPFIPIAWQKDHKGMQGTEYITDKKIVDFKTGVWLYARVNAIQRAKELNGNLTIDRGVGYKIEIIEESGVTKQLCNRLLEPFMWHTVIVTATEWENFFNLRCPQYECGGKIYRSKKEGIRINTQLDRFKEENWRKINKSQAEIHIQAIAELMYDALNESIPKQLKAGEWHIPFGDNMDLSSLPYIESATEEQFRQLKVQIATARCARISYETLGDNPKIDYKADIKLHDILAANGHASPFEHCAKAMSDEEYELYNNGKLRKGSEYFWQTEESQGWCRNFRGFIQYREILENNLNQN